MYEPFVSVVVSNVASVAPGAAVRVVAMTCTSLGVAVGQ